MRRRVYFLLSLVLLICVAPVFSLESPHKQTVYNFSLVDMSGKIVPLSTYKGKVLLIVNLASKSAYRDQIEALNELQKTYGDQGLVVVGIPSGDFGAEELKDPDALRKAYDSSHVAFPVFAAATLRGVHTIPLFQFLCDSKQGLPGGDLQWNFTKILIDREGKPLARFEVSQDPADVDFHVIIEDALAGKFKKKSSVSNTESASDEDDESE